MTTEMTTESSSTKKVVSILDQEYHARLLASLDHYAEVAGVMVHMVHEPLANYCSPEEVEWVKNIMLHKEAGKAGLCLTGDSKVPVTTRMMAMAAALLRNYIDARVVTLVSLLEEHAAGEVESPTVLLIPNLYIKYAGGKPNTNWQLQIIQDLLMRRMVEGKPTIIYVESMTHLREDFGASIVNFIEAHWTIL